MLHGHGNSTIDCSYDINVDFSSNIWYEPLNSGLLNYLKLGLDKICDYPPVDASNLQKKLAENNGIRTKQVCVTSGATEAFYLIAHAFEACNSTIITPSFSEYEDAARMYKHSITHISNQQDITKLTFEEGLMWLGNPNNPDGKVFQVSQIEAMLINNPKSIIVVDEAYGELCYGFESVLKLVNSYDNIIVVKSVTKLCSIPGLRLGYIMASEKLIETIAAYRMPWSVATLALEAGIYIYDHFDEFKIDLSRIKEESGLFQEGLAQCEGITVRSSNTNYLLCQIKGKTAAELKEYLLKEHGFLIRDCSNFQGLNENYFRVAVQGNKNNEACVKAIQEFMSLC
ncbi:pyridoxal phosphate-dependent aminotransferase [Labilibacter marinus]|uniref:pyridoxal phosphate-dependent aminotransferase n=1 Tax=Labilibacter marinus TaxID=1477105 RepID=UPI00094FE839|nr:histidinol-phosphate transaminase [Labilibacter marinus]